MSSGASTAPPTAAPDSSAAAIITDTNAAPSAVSTATGVKTTQIALGADVASTLYGVNGAGEKIGVISDSYNSKGGAAADMANGLLPSNVTVLSDATGTDEARAMLELAYSIAPGATFYTADGGSLAQDVAWLQAAGVNIIVDDLSVDGEAAYQIGSSTEIAIENALAANINYFTSASNSGNDYYEHGFTPLNTTIPGIGTVVANDFGGGNPYQSLTFAIGANVDLMFQWAQPFGTDGSGANSPQNSLAIYLLDANGNIVASSTANEVGAGNDPTQQLQFTNNTSGTAFRLVVVQNGGTVPTGQLFKYFLEDAVGTINDPNAGQGSGDLLGHELLPGVNSVGAAYYGNTPAFGVSPTKVESFSSVGPGTILFDPYGNLLATPITVGDPQFTSADGTTVGTANTNFQNNGFFGTSAAAPSAAAVGALLLQADSALTTTQVTSVLAQSVIPIATAPGVNGAGLIQARAAVEIATADSGNRWNAASGGNWNAATSWSSGTAPTNAQAAGLSDNLGAFTGSYTVTVNTAGDAAGSLSISAPAGSSATLAVASGGVLQVGGSTASNRTAGDLLVSDNGSLNVTGGVITETGSLNVNNGTVTVSLGSITSDNFAENAGQLTVGGGGGAAGLTLTGAGFTETGGVASIQSMGTIKTTLISGSASTFSIATGGMLMDTGTAVFTNQAMFLDAGAYTANAATTFLNATATDSGSFVSGSIGFSESTFTETGSLFTSGALTLDDTGATIAAAASANVGSLGVGATYVGFSSTLTIAGRLTDAGALSQGSSGTTGTVALQTGGELDVGGANSVGINFTGNGLLDYTSTNSNVLLNQEVGVITGLGANNGAIDFTGLTYNSLDTVGYSASNGEADIHDQNGNTVARVFLNPATNYTGQLRVQSDGATNHAEVETVCFASGTLILTVRGEIAVEHLAIGDVVVTASGAHRPIRWLGHRIMDCRNHSRPEQAQPIRIARHALGANKPARDLYVSPAHSVCIDLLGEVLISAGALANGSTITQVEIDQITYWHIELDSHDILIANGLPAESYLDMGNKRFFVESDVIDFDSSPDVDLPEPANRSTADFCRPYVMDGPILQAVRMQLRRRAETMGWTLDGSHPLGDLHLFVGGMRIDPVIRGLTARFTLPVGAADAWLVSTKARPCDVTESDDGRQLGICLVRLTVDEGFGERNVIALDDPLLSDGFYHVEDSSHRWTAGRARLPVALWERCPAEFFLLVEIAGPALPIWAHPPPRCLDQPDARRASSQSL